MILTCWANRWWGSELKGTNSHPPPKQQIRFLGFGDVMSDIHCEGASQDQCQPSRQSSSGIVSCLLFHLLEGIPVKSWEEWEPSALIFSIKSSTPQRSHHEQSRPMRSCFSHHWEVNGRRRGLQIPLEKKKKEKGKKLCFMNVFYLKCFKCIMAILSMNFEVFLHLW